MSTLAERIHSEWGGRLDAWANPASRHQSRCEQTWPSDQTTMAEDTYRQHRCGEAAGHDGKPCRCRYCKRGRWE